MAVFEKDLAQVRIGQQVSVTVPAFPEERFVGRVDYIGQEVDEDTRTVKVRCLVPNPAAKLLPAMYATVQLQSAVDRPAIVVPLAALVTEGEADWLFVKVGTGEYLRREVKVGLRLKDRAVIEAGLAAGDTIVSEGALALRAEEKSTVTTGTPGKEPQLQDQRPQ
jgi:cobalt-zinc-cadmium efflux system membrane fusion protein